ncbi:MAG: cytochrome c [Burkholderiales bacterium]|nr:cytochrome c [Burkholderiales bacterium]
MRKHEVLAAAVAVAAMVLATDTMAQGRTELGRTEYMSTCAGCHGPAGRGDGQYNQFLRLKVPDLTTIAERNGGVFPAERLYAIIDGRAEVPGHGTAQMPIWGNVYNERAVEYYKGFAHNPEQFIRVRILALIDYIYSLQTRR